MITEIAGCDFWYFRELYATLAALADEPEHTVSRLGGDFGFLPGDLVRDLHALRDSAASASPDDDLAVIRVVDEIQEVLDRRSLGGDDFDGEFWTIEGFRDHPDWSEIRDRARAFLLR